MKEFILYIVIAGLLLGMLITPIMTLSDIDNNLHVRYEKVQVVEVNDCVIAVVDGSGEVWEFESDNTYFVGEVFTVKFDTLGTDTIYDDAIVAIKK